MAVVFMLFAAGADSRIGYFDEATHLDAAYSWAHFDPVLRGEPLSTWTLDEWSCRGFYNSDFLLPSCDSQIKSPSAYPAGGINYNSKHPPLYHMANGLFARSVDLLVPGENFLILARFANVFWLLGIIYLAHDALKMLSKLERKSFDTEQSSLNSTVGSCVFFLLFLSHPLVTNAFMYVTNDVAQIFGGALAFWFVIRSTLRRTALLHFIFIGVTLGFLKGFSLSSGAFISFFLLLGMRDKNEIVNVQWYYRVAKVAVIPVAIVLVSYGWGLLVRSQSPYSLETAPLRPEQVSEVGISWATIFSRFMEVVLQLEITQLPPFWSGVVGTAVTDLWEIATVASSVAMIIYYLACRRAESFCIEGRVVASAIVASVSFYLFLSLYLSGFGVRGGQLIYIVSRYMTGLLVPFVFGAALVATRLVKFEKRSLFWVGLATPFALFPIYEFVTI